MGLTQLLLSNLISTVPKSEDFSTCMRIHQADIAGICESWCHGEVPSSMVTMDGFHMVRRDGGLGKGSGVLL